MNRFRAMNIATGVAAVTLGLLASAVPAGATDSPPPQRTAREAANYVAVARFMENWQTYHAFGVTAQSARDGAIGDCQAAHPYRPYKCGLVELHHT
jgi:hypothetical protein